MSSRGPDQNYYQLLGVDPDADPAEIKRAYRQKVRLTHPDLRGPEADSALFKQVRRAYEVLADPLERACYDMMTGLADGTKNARFYYRSFDRLFSSLFTGLQHAALDARTEVAERFKEQERKAG